MSNKTKIVLLAVVALIIGIVIGAMFAPQGSNLGSVRLVQDQFVEGLKAGKTNQFVISNAGVITSSAAVTASKATISNTATSTLELAGATSCIEVKNSIGSSTAITFVGSGATTTTVTATLGTCD